MRREAARILCWCLLLWTACLPAAAQVVSQLTDERTTVAGPAALNDGGTALWVGSSADLAGENPRHTFQIVRFDPTTGAATPLTAFADGAAAVLSVSDDGQWLAFPSPADLTGENHDRSTELFVISSDGAQIAQLTDDPAPDAGSVGGVALSGDGTRIVFTANTDPLGTNPDRLAQLFLIDRDGTNLAQLTQATAGGFGALAISDDATRIVFAHSGDLVGGNPDLGSEVFAIDADGTNLRQLTMSPAGFGSSAPVLSGNGLRIAFQSDADLTGGNLAHQVELFVIDWDNTNLRQLTTTTTVLGLTGDPASQAPSIADDGQSVFYFSNQSTLFPPVNIDGNFEIFRIQADGSGRTQLTSTLLDGGSVLPIVAGGGGRVAYYGVGADLTLEVMDGNGGGALNLLTFDLVFHGEPDVSPAGTTAVFVRSVGLFGTGQLWRIDADGSDLQQVTNFTSGGPAGPSIARDDTTIVFSSTSNDTGGNADGSDEIFKIQSDGLGLTQLTSGPAGTGSSNPVVASDGSVIVFDADADLTGGNPDLSTEIFKIDVGGAGLLQLTAGPIDTFSRLPRVDATGQWVVFESTADLDGGNPDGTFEIYRVRTDGSGLERLTGDPLTGSRVPDISGAGDRIVFSSAADLLGTNPEGNSEVFVYRTDTMTLLQLTSTVEGASAAASITGDGEWVFFSSDAPIFEDDPDRPADLFRIPALGGAIERVGALRAGAPGGLAILGGGGEALAVGDTADVAVFTGIGDFTEANADGLPELWVIDRTRQPAISPGKASPTVVSWSHESGPLRYDVIRGDVSMLADGGPTSVDLGVVICIEDDSPDADTAGDEDTEDPAPGQVFFYLYRGSQGLLDGPGTYGSSSDGRERLPAAGDCPG